MPSITRRVIKGHTYYYAVQSKRINGKPRLTMQKYLGSADDIINAVEGSRTPVEPQKVRVFSFGGVAAAWAMAQRLRLVEIIDQHLAKRDQGLSVGQYLALAAVNRCTAPKSKRSFAEWYAGTSLARLCSVPTQLLAGQRFWDHMQRVDADTIQRIESDLTKHLLAEFGLDLRCLAYDTTNFFTFIDTFNPHNTLARRGKSKEHRVDLRIVGVALLVSMDFHVPLFHHTYPGNDHDSKTFASVTEELVARYHVLEQHCQDITLVFDKGNNSTDNLTTIAATPFHFVGSLPYDQHPQLLEISRKEFKPLSTPRLAGVEVYRTRMSVFGVERTVLVTYNENLYLSQAQTLLTEVAKRIEKLRDLQTSLRRRLEGIVTRGKGPTVESVRNQVRVILKGQHMKTLIPTEVGQENGKATLQYQFDRAALERLGSRVLGKTILFTDNDTWTDDEIVMAYRGQSHVEDAFRTMKNPHFISIRPMYHWTNAMVRVHIFYCVLALTIASLLVRQLHLKGINVSIPRLFKILNQIYETALIWPRGPGRPSRKQRDSFQLSEMQPEQEEIFEALELRRFAPPVV
jgi:transposase